jgi:hypothetical protein
VEAGCTNPAALGGGPAEAHAYLAARGTILGASAERVRWTRDDPEIATPFVKVPGLLSAQCVRKDGFNYLAVTVDADPGDPRTDEIGGDVRAGTRVLANWGLHLIDMNLMLGDLVELTGRQYAAWAAARR